ncbi:sensor domain-containing diguanylate cyclase [Glaciihabitans arcticus]|uniref:bifunctional diguanylate cyclase/phosphodiesterase n=1 Tax=Glaciihabitans arcticus TaxID=2668039 RepID=UPI001386B514|nr:sensor domain-containing diguanylate cyclase [Glaciihabitans arcticus]
MGIPLRVSAAEQQRLIECAREPIRRPDSVQPHGALVVVDAATWQIVSISDNAVTFFGREATDLLGQHISLVTGVEPLPAFAEVLDSATIAANPVRVAVGEQSFDAILNRSGSTALIDFEPVLSDVDSQATAAIFAAMHRLASFTTAESLWAAAARELHTITGFDRVMIYHFHPDAHGEVVAEVAAEGMDPYLGLHYPASDIPSQARELYLLKLSRVIADSRAAPSGLLGLSDPEAVSTVAIDLSRAELRSVSPHHLEFMWNMGQASTMSYSLVRDGELIGMITCAHRTARRVSFEVRTSLEVLANQIALQLSSIKALSAMAKQIELRNVRTRVVSGLVDNPDISRELLGGLATMLDLIPADGATVRLGGIVASVGAAPGEDGQLRLTDALRARVSGLAFASDSLLLDHPDLAPIAPAIAGVLMVPVGVEGDYIAWFRTEKLHSVNWLGDQSASNRATVLSPRNSFTSWSRDVTGVSAPWDDFEAEATELGRDIERVLFHRSESRLALVAQIDPLTGLANRRRLLDRLDHAFAGHQRGDDVTVLFLDLDGLKQVNDSLGHDIGDAVLIRVANQLVSTARAKDTVARIGGDEFVIVCENTSLEQAEVLAQRILRLIRVTAGDAEYASVAITASIGIADAATAADGPDLLKQADAAMYRAKLSGRDRSSR